MGYILPLDTVGNDRISNVGSILKYRKDHGAVDDPKNIFGSDVDLVSVHPYGLSGGTKLLKAAKLSPDAQAARRMAYQEDLVVVP